MQKSDLTRIIGLGIPSTESQARAILGATGTADYRTLRKAYRRLAGEAHPDRFANDPSLTTQATQAMQVINAAWEIIDGLHGIGALGSSPSQEAPRTSGTRSSQWNPTMRVPRADECDLCGSWPAQHVHIRSLTTVLIWFSPGNYQGTVCRSCGTALFRNALRRTMIGGWWGIATIATPIYFLLLLGAHSKLKSMRPPAFRDVNVAAPFRSPVVPPKSPLKSFGPMLMTGVALFITLWFIYNIATAPTPSTTSDSPSQSDTITGAVTIGTCFRAAGSEMVNQVDCSEPHNYIVTSTGTNSLDCPATGAGYVSTDPGVACLTVDS
ncbi:MAG: J domain-containing protein [Actinobacteria bacterium]|nr:J domain-containing protein [Actinomycetota bacterium]